MNLSIINKYLNTQYFISYLGVLPYIFVFIDINISKFFPHVFLKDFIFFYSLIIFIFIGAMRWSFQINLNPLNIFYGFLPSLFSTILIFLYLLNYNLLFIFLFFFYLLQLFIDYKMCKKNYNEREFFIFVRLPVTIIILLNIFYLILV